MIMSSSSLLKKKQKTCSYAHSFLSLLFNIPPPLLPPGWILQRNHNPLPPPVPRPPALEQRQRDVPETHPVQRPRPLPYLRPRPAHRRGARVQHDAHEAAPVRPRHGERKRVRAAVVVERARGRGAGEEGDGARAVGVVGVPGEGV